MEESNKFGLHISWEKTKVQEPFSINKSIKNLGAGPDAQELLTVTLFTQ